MQEIWRNGFTPTPPPSMASGGVLRIANATGFITGRAHSLSSPLYYT